MSASSPIPEGVRRDLERMAGPLAERMRSPRVEASSTTRNVVAAVNSDGTLDISMGGAVMQRVPATTACAGVAAGDEVIVERYGPRLFAVGVVARSLDNPDYVSREVTSFASNFKPYSSSYPPTLQRHGPLVVLVGAVASIAAFSSSNDETELFTIPQGFRPAIVTRALCQGSGKCSWLLQVNVGGTATLARYGTTENTTVPENAWLLCAATWMTDDKMPAQ